MKIYNPPDFYQRLQEHYNPDAEEVWVACLNSQLEVTSLEMVHRGTVSMCLAIPRDIFRAAVRTNSQYILLAHNHTSGDCTPSGEDLELTRELCLASRILKIPIIDHLIFTPAKYVSFAQLGLIKRFMQSRRKCRWAERQ